MGPASRGLVGGGFACVPTLAAIPVTFILSPQSLPPPQLTAEGLLELLGELLDHTVALHVVHVVIQGVAGHLPQGAHVHTPHADGENLDACVPSSLGHVLDDVLRTPVCDNDGDL